MDHSPHWASRVLASTNQRRVRRRTGQQVHRHKRFRLSRLSSGRFRKVRNAEIRSALQASKFIQLQIAAVSSVRSLLRPHCFAELAAVTCGSPK